MLTSQTITDIVLLGGMVDLLEGIEQDQIGSFLNYWDCSRMQYIILDTASDGVSIHSFADLALPIANDLLRLNIFGDGGDLLVRRDDDRLLWRYIGFQDVAMIAPDFTSMAFAAPLHVKTSEDKSALLWGSYNDHTHTWYEGRVGKAKLSYPVSGVVKAGQRAVSYAHTVRDVEEKIVAFWTFDLKIKGS